MKKFAVLAASLSFLAWSTGSIAAEHRNRYPVGIHVDKSRPCLFFYLHGVTQPDPAVHGPAFAIPRSHPAFAELVAMLLTARAAGQMIGVFTTGAAACDLPEVNVIVIEGIASQSGVSASPQSSSLTGGPTVEDQPQP